MKYKIRQKVFSFADNFIIKDESDRPWFVVKGKFFSIGDKLAIEDLDGNQLFYIEQNLFKLLPEYHIFQSNIQVAKVKKELTFFKPKFSIESKFGEYEVNGDIFSYSFQVIKNKRIVATVNKKWFTFADTYGVNIIDEENHPFLLTLVIVIDQVVHDKSNSNNSN
ncbi:LURP-one-related family protein [Clostridium sp. HMP27]|uniref:LURP-one-related/scramblase family protein n=1 Tax=Clostridium sp. HMP27 TaxID=1487921 RepID=UPI00052C8A8D|nr:LURP-one-related family protein [Clostridium sp. HMP27]KGK87772.1 hypothetical protein DP68_10890 [Clostridium sp. HMP27]